MVWSYRCIPLFWLIYRWIRNDIGLKLSEGLSKRAAFWLLNALKPLFGVKRWRKHTLGVLLYTSALEPSIYSQPAWNSLFWEICSFRYGEMKLFLAILQMIFLKVYKESRVYICISSLFCSCFILLMREVVSWDGPDIRFARRHETLFETGSSDFGFAPLLWVCLFVICSRKGAAGCFSHTFGRSIRPVFDYELMNVFQSLVRFWVYFVCWEAGDRKIGFCKNRP